MSRTRQFIRGVGTNYINQAVVMLVGLWMTRFLLETLGSYTYGLWYQIPQILAYLALVDAGVGGLLPREVAHATGTSGADSARKVADVVGPVVRIVIWQTVLAALGAALVAIQVLPPASAAPIRFPLGLVLVTFVLTFPLRIFALVLNGLQDLAFLGVLQLISWLLGTAVTLAGAVMGYGLTALAAGWATGQIFPAIMSWRRLRSRFGATLDIHAPAMSWDLLRSVVGRSGWVALNQVAQVMMASSDLLIIGRVMGSAMVMPYVCTEKLASLFEQQPQMLLQGAQPGLAQLRTGESRERMVQAATALQTVVLVLSGGLLCVVLAVNHGFVIWWVKAPSWAGYTVTALIVARVIIGHWLVTLGLIAFCMGYERRLAITAVIGGALTVGLSVVAVRMWGWLGIPIGAMVASVLVSAPVYLITLSRELQRSVAGLLGSLWPFAWRFSLLASFALLAGNRWPPTSVPQLAAATIAVSVVYAIIMLPIVVRPPVSLYLHPALYHALLRLPRVMRGNGAAAV
jgi:O-antigen/teichoic acid export membrane protein